MNRRKKLTAVVLSACLVGVLGIGATLMFFTDTDTKKNVITIGKVDGTLTETGSGTEREDGTGFDYEDVMPGNTLDKKPVVTLADDSQPAYLRVKMEVTNLTAEQAAELIEGIDINTENWAKGADGYYYYQNVLQPGDAVTFFETVKIPTSWDQELASVKFDIDVTAELIQSANFEGNLQKENNMITGWTVTE